jgi:hypothetical protein
MPDWRTRRIALRGDWQHLSLWRLGNSDLLLSKLMRYEPIDQADARFIVASAGLTRKEIEQALQAARLPDSDEVREQFSLASASLLESLATL